jgi:hypothetical protein
MAATKASLIIPVENQAVDFGKTIQLTFFLFRGIKERKY